MADLGMAGLVPCHPREVVLRVEILEANIPDESAERLDGVDLVPLRADETEPQGHA